MNEATSSDQAVIQGGQDDNEEAAKHLAAEWDTHQGLGRHLAVGMDDSKKRPRTAFSTEQVRSLEQEFHRNKYLSMAKRMEMSKQLGLTEQQVSFLTVLK